ncbi:MAG: glycosyltransferase [Candidatus Firestonebacteria bacterium]
MKKNIIADIILNTFVLLLAVIPFAWLILAMLNVYLLKFSFRKGFVALSFISLFIFLCILIIRYFGLIYFSYLNFTFHDADKSKKEPVEYPLVSILLPAYNEGKNIEESIKSLIALDYPFKEIVIINDGSKDDSLARAKKYEGIYSNATVKVLSQTNQGKAKALNNGIKNSTGAFILCMDGDSIIDKNAIKMAIPHFRDPKIGAVAGNIKIINIGNTLTRLQSLEYMEGLNMVKHSQGFFKAVNIVPGPFGLFRRTAMDSAGGYDSDTFAEDCDLTIKLLSEGWEVVYEPESLSWTEAPETMNALFVQRYRWSRGILQVLKKHRQNLWRTKGTRVNTLTIWYMFFEAIIWPIMNVFAQVFFVYVAVTYGMLSSLLFWWIQLTLLDMTAALHCVLIEKERLNYVLYAIPYRLYFILVIDVVKLLATLEEVLGVKMEWGRVERKGRLKST